MFPASLFAISLLAVILILWEYYPDIFKQPKVSIVLVVLFVAYSLLAIFRASQQRFLEVISFFLYIIIAEII